MSRNPGVLFYGRLNQQHRGVMLAIMRGARDAGYERVYIPCCGTFTLADLAIMAGFDRAAVFASDISLFSSVLGYALAGRDIAALDVRTHDLDDALTERLAGFGPSSAGAALVAFKLANTAWQLETRAQRDDATGDAVMNAYEAQFTRELAQRLDAHVADMDDQIAALVKRVGGIRYEAEDMFVTLERGLDDPKALVVVAAPYFARDYEQQQEVGTFLSWNEPQFTFYDPVRDEPRLEEQLLAAPALALWTRWLVERRADDRQRVEKIAERCVMADWTKSGTVEAIWANRPDEAIIYAGGPFATERRTVTARKPPWPVIDEVAELDESSVLEVVEIDAEEAQYYRDLLVHGLGSTQAERAFVLLLDGQVVTVFGTNASQLFRGVATSIEKVYGITRTSRFWRYNRLASQAVLADAVIRMAVGGKTLHRCEGVRTTVFSPHREDKSIRGSTSVMESREWDARRRRWRIRTYGPRDERSLADIYREWYAKELRYQQQRGLERPQRTVWDAHAIVDGAPVVAAGEAS